LFDEYNVFFDEQNELLVDVVFVDWLAWTWIREKEICL